jgi:hypothetical protein
MYHGIYVKTKPKSKWLLFSVVVSAEEASAKIDKALMEAEKGGYEQVEVAVKIFDYFDYIPEMLNEVKDQGLLYN